MGATEATTGSHLQYGEQAQAAEGAQGRGAVQFLELALCRVLLDPNPGLESFPVP